MAKDLWPSRVRCVKRENDGGSGRNGGGGGRYGGGGGGGGGRNGGVGDSASGNFAASGDEFGWKCSAVDLDPRVRIGEFRIQCEGYYSEDNQMDDFILKGNNMKGETQSVTGETECLNDD